MNPISIFVGIDPSLRSTGVVTLDDEGNVLSSTTIGSDPPEDAIHGEIKRLSDLADAIIGEVYGITSEPDIICMEGLSFASSMSGHSGLVGLHYILRAKLHEDTRYPVLVQPTSLKKFIGKGNMKKNEVMLACYKTFGFEASSDDEVDAYILAQIARSLGGYGSWNERQKEVIDLLTKKL